MLRNFLAALINSTFHARLLNSHSFNSRSWWLTTISLCVRLLTVTLDMDITLFYNLYKAMNKCREVSPNALDNFDSVICGAADLSFELRHIVQNSDFQ